MAIIKIEQQEVPFKDCSRCRKKRKIQEDTEDDAQTFRLSTAARLSERRENSGKKPTDRRKNIHGVLESWVLGY